MIEDESPDDSFLFEDVPVASCCDICDINNSKLFLDNKIVQLSETEIEVLSYRIDHPTKSLCAKFCPYLFLPVFIFRSIKSTY